jgi:hypothetical protein
MLPRLNSYRGAGLAKLLTEDVASSGTGPSLMEQRFTGGSTFEAGARPARGRRWTMTYGMSHVVTHRRGRTLPFG